VVLLAGIILLVEMTYHFSLERASGNEVKVFGMKLDVTSLAPWLGAVASTAVGGFLFNAARKRVGVVWDDAMTAYTQMVQGNAK
jgi:branched-chain amino acid transport system permease protein